ncbi:Rne/Rng family ribonuclease [Dysgonomonas sp. 520]|uniref:Rne/Rng family ribonuclease n=1 Tax=Dysgonomonas sp. 520 TaxID=2302931 RepID=UPI0013D5DDFD|nr:Rne/Rng family ribonuclease [Dysgonomonas sp. 520]NDW08675.1 Rne/Rng family ribonuclease [Dysgonomonas sp. 520]
MNSELIIDVQPKEVSIAVLEDKKLVELQKEGRDASFSVGNVYAARVKKLLPGLNAAFIDVGHKKDAFLHYLDLGPQFKSVDKFYKKALADKKKFPQLSKFQLEKDIDKDGSITDVLTVGQEILVQVAKEPISTKGPRLTSELSFAGRFLVLIPFNDKVSVSQKIKSKEERIRLQKLLQSIKPKNFGVIVRTVAEGKKVVELDTELKTLVKRWDENMPKIQKGKLPTLIYEETGRIVGLLRDVFSPSFQEIHVNDQDTYNQVKDYLTVIAPEKKDIVKLYTGDLPIFDNFAVTKQIKALFGKTVTFKYGAYLIIEHTEALHVIDVNSGNRTKSKEGQETTAFEVNSLAAEEIARQLRLRDLGGIIVIDFIDMTEGEHRSKLLVRMQELMANDRAKHNILPLSKFGLMQITRQRVRPEMEINTTEACPSCFGKGETKPSILFVDSLQSKISYLVKKLKVKKFTLHIHPYVAAYINQGVISLKMRWKWKYGNNFKIIPDQSLAYLEYHFYDENKEEIDLKQEIELK